MAVAAAFERSRVPPLTGSSAAVDATFGWERASAAAGGYPQVPICELMAFFTPLFFYEVLFLNESALFV